MNDTQNGQDSARPDKPKSTLAALAKSMQRFSYVKYDAEAQAKQEEFKKAFEKIEVLTEGLRGGREKSLVLTYLEISYMWTGKAIRDEQIARDAAAPHEPARTDSPE